MDHAYLWLVSYLPGALMGTSSSTSVTVTVGILAAAFGLSLGHLSAKYEGIEGTGDISRELASADLDASRLPIAGSPARGGIQAAATVVFFADFQCKASRELYGKLMDDVFKTHGENVKIVYKAYPLSSHKLAPFAAQAAHAAQNQNKFWEMFDAIYAESNKDASGEAYLSPENLRRYAQNIGLDMTRYDADIQSAETLSAIQKDIDLGKRLGVNKTPSVFINGKPVVFTKGVNSDELLVAVNQEIKRIDGFLAKPNAKYYIAQLLSGDTGQLASATTDLGRSMKGSPDALVTIVEFSDYECPFCSRVEPTVERILKEYPNDVRVIFTHNPLSFHKNAKLAAQAAYAAGLQNKFWEMHALLFANQKKLTRDDLLKYAADLKLDAQKFSHDLDAPSTVAVIESNMAEAKKFGFTGTPAFLINNQAISGAQPFEAFKKAIDEELAEAKEVAQKTGLHGDALFQELLKSYKPVDRKQKSARNKLPEGKIFVDINGAPSFGDPQAPVVIVEFTDFECPFCARANTTVKQLIENNPGKVRLVFKHNPLSFHKNAQLAHQAAEAASLQGKFWEYYQLLFDNQKALTREHLLNYARQLDLNMDAFEKDLDSDIVKNRVTADLNQGTSVQVKGTPHFFINGTRFSGAQPLEEFQKALNKELDIAKAYTDKNLTGEALYRAIITDGKAENRRPLRARPMQRKNMDLPLKPIDTSGHYAKGPENAPVTIIQFSDFQCPFCKTVEPTLDRLMKEYEGKVRVVFMHKPLPFHADAELAAEASLAAGEQGKFWEMHNLLFKNNKALRREHLNIYADQLGLDRTKFDEALNTHKFLPAVKKDMATASEANIDATPSFILNGKRLSGAMPYEDFKKHIDAALAAPAPTP